MCGGCGGSSSSYLAHDAAPLSCVGAEGVEHDSEENVHHDDCGQIHVEAEHDVARRGTAPVRCEFLSVHWSVRALECALIEACVRACVRVCVRKCKCKYEWKGKCKLIGEGWSIGQRS